MTFSEHFCQNFCGVSDICQRTPLNAKEENGMRGIETRDIPGWVEDRKIFSLSIPDSQLQIEFHRTSYPFVLIVLVKIVLVVGCTHDDDANQTSIHQYYCLREDCNVRLLTGSFLRMRKWEKLNQSRIQI